MKIRTSAKGKTNEPVKVKKKPHKRIRERARGALATIGILLIASGVIRIATGAGEAFAREGDPNQTQPFEADLPTKVNDDGATIVRVTEPELQALLDALERREARVDSLEIKIDVRLKALSIAEREIDRKLIELSDAEARLSETLSLARGASDRDVEQLTQVYSNMKPKQAAALFQEMDPEFAAGFLSRMRPNAAAAIMAGLDPRSAYTISVMLAGRHVDVPKE